MEKPIKDLTGDLELTSISWLPDAFDYALHYVTEKNDVKFRWSDIEVTIKGV